MTTFTVDSNGDRIKTDILACGYVRQEIENVYKIMIPSEIKQLCFVYWFINICDEWDKTLMDGIDCDKQIVKSTDGHYATIYGMNVIKSGTYEWWLKLHHIHYGCICIGIIENKSEYLNKHLTNFDYDMYGYGCWWYPTGNLYGISETGGKSEKFTKSFKCGNEDIKDVVIGMKVDLDTKSISYSIDGDEYKKAPCKIRTTECRLAVSLLAKDDQVELL